MQVRIFVGWLIIFLFGGFMLGVMSEGVVAQEQASGIPIGETELVVTPNFPLAAEPVQITVKGIWSDACIPVYEAHRVVDSRILITFLPSTAEVCGQSETPWSFAIPLETLPVAEYQVEVQGPVTVSTTLTVVQERIYLPWIGND